MDNLAELLNCWLNNTELQAAVLVGLTCVGAWVVLTWLLCVVVSCLWPFFLFVGLVFLFPQMSTAVGNEMVPKYSEFFEFLHKSIQELITVVQTSRYCNPCPPMNNTSRCGCD